jgi:hypothetical protein
VEVALRSRLSGGFGLLLVGLALTSATACQPGGGGSGRRDSGTVADGGTPGASDADGDGIADVWEGATDGVDTDGDGTPDYRDSDSDDDGILDSVEGQAAVGTGEPADSDSDGTYDFRDLDSDGNGIPDQDEIDDDIDADGDPAYRDGDDDGDFINDGIELAGTPASPPDADGDGAADFQDIDSDGDTISDLNESVGDTDADGRADRFDDDSDGDGYTDAEEAGDADWRTPPLDTDGDLIADFRDPDSDGDGLSDEAERAGGTSPTLADTDGDGVSDLVELAACPAGEPSCAGDATNPDSSPRSRGDFVFFEPYMMRPLPERDTLDFATDIRVADVYFLMDTTGSMGSSVTSLRSSLATFITEVRREIPDVWIGNGDFKDYPVSPYGGTTDFAYRNCQNLTGDEAAAVAGLSCYAVSGGADGPESHTPALWAAATGMGLVGRSGTAAPPGCAAGYFGYPCFREGAVPIVVVISDVTSHNGPGGSDAYSDSSLGGHAPTYAEAIDALRARNVRVIGIGQGTGGRAYLESVARDTGAVDGSGAPLYSTWSGGAIGTTVLDQIRTLSNQTRFDISVSFDDDTSDAVDSFAAFVDHIEANTAGDPARGCEPRTATDTDGDGYPDTFPDVTAGNRVCFDIVVKQNDTVMPTTMPQLFRATLRVLGDGFTELDSRDVFFLVPGTVRDPGAPD